MAGLLDGRSAGDGFLTDGVASIRYRDLDVAIAAVLRALEATPGRIEIVCDGGLGSAIAVLACVHGRRDAALVPAGARASADCAASARVSLDGAERLDVAIEASPGAAAGPAESGIAVATSGSTGRPKRALHRHASLVSNAAACVDRLGLTAGDRVAVPVPFFHMYGLGAALLPAVLAGASVDLQPRANAMRFVARERAFDPTVAFLTPSFACGLLAARHGARAYRLTVLAGDRIAPAAFERYEERHGPTVSLYGTTELGAIAASRPDDPLEARVDGAGTPMRGVELTLRPGAAGRDELWVRRADGFAGYLDEAGRLEAAPRIDGWYATHDHAELSPGGRVRLLGRADDAVKRDGRLVHLADLEATLTALPGVAKAAVVEVERTPRGAGLVAFVAPCDGEELDGAALRRAAAAALPPHAVPDRFVVLALLPLLGTGKVDRQALRARSISADA